MSPWIFGLPFSRLHLAEQLLRRNGLLPQNRDMAVVVAAAVVAVTVAVALAVAVGRGVVGVVEMWCFLRAISSVHRFLMATGKFMEISKIGDPRIFADVIIFLNRTLFCRTPVLYKTNGPTGEPGMHHIAWAIHLLGQTTNNRRKVVGPS